MMETFFEAVLQVFVQLYFVIASDDIATMGSIVIFSALISLASVSTSFAEDLAAFALDFFQGEKKENRHEETMVLGALPQDIWGRGDDTLAKQEIDYRAILVYNTMLQRLGLH